MTWTKYNNPSRKRKPRRKKMDRTDAEIIAGKQMIIDSKLGYTTVKETYDHISDKLCDKPSRDIY